jgi:Zn-finger nucleic acid-binding protein
MAPPRCSNCGSTLDPVTLNGLAAHRCGKCSGLWVDLSVLDAAAAETFELQPLGDPSPHACARCGQKLTQVAFPGGIPLEGCLSCRGVFLRDGTDHGLVDLVIGLPERRAASKRKAKASDGFKIATDVLDGIFKLFK